MRVLAPATEDDMVLTFLRAEVDSPRFAGPLLLALGEQGLDRALVDRADRTDPEENAARRRLLATYRGHGRNEALFAGLPDDISWSWVALTPAELADVRYIDWDYWLEVSGGTRRPRDAIARMRADWDAEGSDYRRIAVAAARRSLPPELVVLGRPPGQDLVLLEGHVRLTGLLLDPQRLPGELRVLLGTSPRIAEWGLYGS
jgi:hypothetical protein